MTQKQVEEVLKVNESADEVLEEKFADGFDEEPMSKDEEDRFFGI